MENHPLSISSVRVCCSRAKMSTDNVYNTAIVLCTLPDHALSDDITTPHISCHHISSRIHVYVTIVFSQSSDSRIFMNELMAGLFGDSAEQSGDYQALSNVTLALAQDSGWYEVDYRASGQALPFAQDRGCAFALTSCKSDSTGDGESFESITGEGKIFCSRRDYQTCSVRYLAFLYLSSVLCIALHSCSCSQ